MTNNKQYNDGAMAFYRQISVRLLDAQSSIKDNVADRGLSELVLCQFHKFLWEELKSFLGKEWEIHLKEKEKNND